LFFDAAAARDLLEFQCRRFAIENEHQLQRMFRHEACGSIEKTRKVRSNTTVRIAQRRSITQTNQREKLIQLAVPVDPEPLPAELLELCGLLDDDRSEKNTHFVY